MICTTLYTIIMCISIVVLILMAVFSTLSAIDTYNSPNYMNDTNLRSSTEYSSIAAGLVWTILIILVVVFLYAYLSNTLKTFNIDYENDLLTHTSDYIIIILKVINSIAILTATIFSALSVSYLSEINDRDDLTYSAYVDSIVALVSGLFLFSMIIMAAIVYVVYGRSRTDNLSTV